MSTSMVKAVIKPRVILLLLGSPNTKDHLDASAQAYKRLPRPPLQTF